MRDTSRSIGLLKLAAGTGAATAAGEALAKGLQTAYHSGKKLVQGSADFGGGVAKGFGAPETVGKVLGVGAVGAAGYHGSKKIKSKLDEIKFQMQYGNPYQTTY